MSREQVTSALTQSLNSGAVQSVFLRFSDENGRRPVRPSRCLVAEITDVTGGFSHIAPGTVTVFVAKESEPLLGRLITAIDCVDSKAFNVATTEIKQMEADIARAIQVAMGGPISPRPSATPIPSFAQINYADKTLISHIYVDEVLRVNAHVFPYNGGNLDPTRFSMLEYNQGDFSTPLSCIFVIRKPQLSDIEKEALALVPSNHSANNIGSSALFFTPILVWIAEAAAAAAVGWVVGKVLDWLFGVTALASIPDEVLKSDDFQRKVRSLPPEVTAAELLRLRMDILLQGPANPRPTELQ